MVVSLGVPVFRVFTVFLMTAKLSSQNRPLAERERDRDRDREGESI